MREPLKVQCQSCGNIYEMFVDPNSFGRWRRGEYAQVAFSYLSAAERELLLSGTCGTCFDAMFPEEDED